MRHCMEPAYTSLNCVRRLTETRNGDYARHPMQGLGDSAMSRRIIQDLSFTPLVSGCGRGFSPTTPISFSRKQPNPRKDLCPAGHRANPFNNPPPTDTHSAPTFVSPPTLSNNRHPSKKEPPQAVPYSSRRFLRKDSHPRPPNAHSRQPCSADGISQSYVTGTRLCDYLAS